MEVVIVKEQNEGKYFKVTREHDDVVKNSKNERARIALSSISHSYE